MPLAIPSAQDTTAPRGTVQHGLVSIRVGRLLACGYAGCCLPASPHAYRTHYAQLHAIAWEMAPSTLDGGVLLKDAALARRPG